MFDRELANKQREIAQSRAEEMSFDTNFLLLEWATGAGKGLACMRILDRDTSGKKWLVVVPEILQIENLKADIEKHSKQHLYEKIEAIICYASFKDYTGWEGNIWFNEVHKLSKLKADISKTIKYHKILADSATVPDHVKQRLGSLGKFTTYSIPLKEAISTGILPEPSVHIIYTEADDKIKRNVVKRGDYSNKLTDKDFIKDLEGRLDFWRKKEEEAYHEGKDTGWIRLKMNQVGNIRKKFIAGTKTPYLKKLLKELKGKRLICFTGSIDQCNDVGGTEAIHSKKTRKHNIQTLQAFNDGELDKIYMQKMGREGLNLERIEAVIVVQLGSGNDDGLEFIQISGRGLRSDSPELYLLCCKGTKDEIYLRKALQNIDKKYVYEQKEKVSETAKTKRTSPSIGGKIRKAG